MINRMQRGNSDLACGHFYFCLQFIVDAGGANVGESVRSRAFNMSDARDVASFHTVSSVRRNVVPIGIPETCSSLIGALTMPKFSS
jgi:hypothetical protein